jgi:hypothetical protein
MVTPILSGQLAFAVLSSAAQDLRERAFEPSGAGVQRTPAHS